MNGVIKLITTDITLPSQSVLSKKSSVFENFAVEYFFVRSLERAYGGFRTEEIDIVVP